MSLTSSNTQHFIVDESRDGVQDQAAGQLVQSSDTLANVDAGNVSGVSKSLLMRPLLCVSVMRALYKLGAERKPSSGPCVTHIAST